MYIRGRSTMYFKRVCHISGTAATGGTATVSTNSVCRPL